MAGRKITSDDVMRFIQNARFTEVLRMWDRAEFEHPAVPGRIAVPLHEKDFPPGALRSIEKHASKALGEEVTVESTLKHT